MEGLITKGKHIVVEMGNPCKVAIAIDLTWCIAIQKFDFLVLDHLNCYNYNLHFHTIGAIEES